MRQVYDFDEAADCKAAGVLCANLVASDIWPLLRQIAVHLREKDLVKLPDDVAAVAALNGRQAGRRELLGFIEKLAALAQAPPASESPAAALVRGVGTGPV